MRRSLYREPLAEEPEELEKAAVAHLRRAPKGGLARVSPGPEPKAYRGGQFIDNATWWAERDRAARALPDLLDAFGDRLQFLRRVYVQNSGLLREGTTKVDLMPLTTIEAQTKAAIREVYASAFRYGKRAAGNLTSITPDEAKALTKLRRDEFKYLRGFLEAIRSDKGRMSYEQRMDYYRAAAREAYWAGWLLGDTRASREIEWTLGPTEHCADCLRFANLGWLKVASFIKLIFSKGYLPQSGRLDCLGYNCQCKLTERRL